MNNIFQAKINGILELPEALNKDNDYSIALEQCCVKRIETKELAEDDTLRTTFILENIGRVNIITEKEGKPHLIKSKAKKCSKSQILRLKIEALGLEYDKTMDIILNKFEELI